MSSSLVRKALELVESGPEESKDSSKSSKHELKRPMKSKRKSNFDHRQRTLGDVKSEAALLVKRARKQAVLNEDKTSANLQLLVSYSNSKGIDFNKASKIWEQTGKWGKPVDETAPESESVFTEEDFRKFEESYFIN